MQVEAVLRAIDLKDDFHRVANEIRHIGSHGDLAADVKFLEAMRLERMPELALRRRHLAPQPLCLRPQPWFHVSMRRPIPSPLVWES